MSWDFKPKTLFIAFAYKISSIQIQFLLAISLQTLCSLISSPTLPPIQLTVIQTIA